MTLAGRCCSRWRGIPCTPRDVDLQTLLSCGQAFTWQTVGENIWANVLKGKIFLLKQTDTELQWCTPSHYDSRKNQNSIGCDNPPPCTCFTFDADDSVNSAKKTPVNEVRADESAPQKRRKRKSVVSENGDSKISKLGESGGAGTIVKEDKTDVSDDENVLVEYFALDVDLKPLYESWSAADSHFATISQDFNGIRMLQQDPTENLFSFICSSNNHISRIASMVNKLSQNFGTKVGTVNSIDFYSFPLTESLAQPGVEVKLRELGFGYRAKFIAKSAYTIHHERPAGWLNSLKSLPYKKCIAELMQLCGVGRKVADCVALMSLKKHEAVPVDTHVLQIATRDFRIPGVSKEMKSLTPAIHDKIGEFFVKLYGPYAGWAHTVLFAADLRQFSGRKTSASVKKKTKSRK